MPNPDQETKPSPAPAPSTASGSPANFSNGVDATTGRYLPSPASLEALAELLENENVRPLGKDYYNNSDLESADDVDPQDLGAAGWGVIFAEGADPLIREALSPLLELRQRQATRLFEGGYREFWGPLAYRKGQAQDDFLDQWEWGTHGQVDTSLMPHYLLLVGSPEEIGFDFQYEMDVVHAVGRIHFDTPDEYARYAEAVVAAEGRQQAKKATVFAARNGDDMATRLLLNGLVLKVLEGLQPKHPGWSFERILEQEATKQRLKEVLRQPPSLLFTAGHGLAYPSGHKDQVERQGAIVCSDWSGQGALPPSVYYSASDVDQDVDLAGTIVFQLSCFGAATPGQDDYENLALPWPAAERPFVASLPKQFLSRGALAVVGHVDRIWTCSFFNEETNKAENLVFENFLSRILNGKRIGHASDRFNQWHAKHAIRLSKLLFQVKRGEAVDKKEIATTWLVNNDARNYVVLGDPAVRLGVE
jgi:hypothetical protein